MYMYVCKNVARGTLFQRACFFFRVLLIKHLAERVALKLKVKVRLWISQSNIS